MSAPSTLSMFRWIVVRDLTLAWKGRVDVLSTLFFFLIVVSLFPLGIGPETHLLRLIAPGVVWVAALLASMLSLGRLFASDYQDGTLEQLLLTPQPLYLVVLGKVLALWLVSGALIGSIGAALTLGLRGGGLLISILVLPLYIPVLIFGAGAVDASIMGSGVQGSLSFLGTLLVLSLVFAPWAAAAALRISLE